MAIYSVICDHKYIYAQLSSREFARRYDQYFFCVFERDNYPSKENYRLRFSTKQDLIRFTDKLWLNYDSLSDIDRQQEFLFELLNKTANQWGCNKKLKTKRLLNEICKNM